MRHADFAGYIFGRARAIASQDALIIKIYFMQSGQSFTHPGPYLITK